MKTADDVALALGRAAVIFNAELSPERLTGYLGVLLPVASAESLCAAIEASLLRCRYFPSPAEIIEAAGGTDKAKAAEAWTEAVRRASLGPERRGLDCPDDIAETIRLIGGWSAIASTATDKLSFLERRFLEIYTPTAAKIENSAAIELAEACALEPGRRMLNAQRVGRGSW